MKTDVAPPGVSLLISVIIAVAVVMTLLWPQPPANLARQWLDSLPPPAAGVSALMEAPRELTEPLDWVNGASQAEGWLAEPSNEDFRRLRDYLTQALVNSDRFDRYPEPVTISLSEVEHKQAIKYLVESRPGMMSVIYYIDEQENQGMLVYWPEVAGDTLVYTPLGGTSAKAVSTWLQEQVAAGPSQPR